MPWSADTPSIPVFLQNEQPAVTRLALAGPILVGGAALLRPRVTTYPTESVPVIVARHRHKQAHRCS
jgi:hypothetical protein